MKTTCFLGLVAVLLSACAIRSIDRTFPGADNCHTDESCEQSCLGGDAHACGFMSQAALVGSGVPRSAEQFIAYAAKGCDANDGRSCAQLAFGYFKGIGVAKDWPKAADYNDRACRNAFPIGCNSLGLQYRDGLGLAKDAVRADALFTQACDGGSALGCLQLAVGAPDGMVPEAHATKALPLLAHDCDPQRNPEVRVCTVAARMYAAGRGTGPDEQRAKSLYDAACKRGDPNTCDQLRRP